MKYEGIEIWANSIRALVLITALAAAVCVIVYRAEIEELTGEPATPEMQAALEEMTAAKPTVEIVEWPDGFIGTKNGTTDYVGLYVDMPVQTATIITISAGGAITVYDPTTGNLSIRINPDGSSEIGPDYKPDVAAKQFWDALARYMPQWKGVK